MYGATLLLALREMRRHLMRSFLTTLGIIIGIAGVVTMVTLGKGVTASVAAQINSFGSNAFFIVPVAERGVQPKPFKQADVDAIKEQLAGVRAAAGQVQRSVTVFHNGQDWAATVEGGGNDYMDARSITLEEGRRFTPAEEAGGANVCIIGPTMRDKIFVAGASPLGEQMRVDKVSCTVIGVFKSRAVGGSDDLGYMIVTYDAGYDSKVMQVSLVELMRERRLIPPGQDPDFDLVDTAQANEAIATTLALMTAMVAAIAGIALVVSGIGIMNIMLVSVTERTREIGIRLAIGARAREVRLQFLTEAVVLCCFGGVMGLVLALGISWLVATKAMQVPFVFDPVSNLVAFVFCGLFGIAFGYYPARRASKLDPIDALRHE